MAFPRVVATPVPICVPVVVPNVKFTASENELVAPVVTMVPVASGSVIVLFAVDVPADSCFCHVPSRKFIFVLP